MNTGLQDNTASGLSGINAGTTPSANNFESAYQRKQAPQSAELNPGNNLNDTYNHFQPGQPGAGLNENHGIAATGLNEPHTHATVNPVHGNNLNNKIEQHENYGTTAGQDLNSHTNRTGGTGIPPVNTAEHVRRNQAEEAVLNSERNSHTHGNNEISHKDQTAGHDLNSHTNRTGGTGIPPVNTAEHVRQNKAEEALRNAEHDNHTHSNNESAHKSNTDALGDHGASHHDKKDGGVGHGERVAAKHEERRDGGHTQSAHNPEQKVSAGDKIKGSIEKVVGKITGNEEKVIKGENLVQGRAA
ncbi:unnamed protein product [Mucor hiemalis]